MNHAFSRRLARGAIRLANWLVDGTVLSAVVLIVLFTTFAVLDNNRVASGATTTMYDSYRPESDDDPTFAELKALNSDVVGWLTLYGTGVDYPLVQGESNDTYINRNPSGEFALSGSVFLDYRCASDFSGLSTIIYGHHMENSLMFGDLDQYVDPEYFSAHRLGNLYYGDKNHGIEVVGYLLVDAYDTVVYSTTVGEDPSAEYFLAYLEAHASQWEPGVTPDDHLLVLSTCGSGTNDRHIVVARICDETFADPTPQEEKVSRTLEGTAEGVRLGMQVGAGLIGFLLIAWVVGAPNERRKKRRFWK